jgi:hypothetical protein
MNSHNLIATSGYRFTAQRCTYINNNALSTPPPHPKKKNDTCYRIQEMYLQREE